MKYTFTLPTLMVLFFIGFSAYGQRKLFVQDGTYKNAIPFVKIYPSEGQPFLSDIDGAFEISNSASFTIKSAGYADSTFSLANLVSDTLFLFAKIQTIQEVKAVAGENPAHRIVELAIQNRKKNNPVENDAFTYDSYSKFVFEPNPEAMEKIPTDTQDSNLMNIKQFFGEQYLFLLESASTRTFIPPAKDHEEITAYKVSGFKDPLFSTFAQNIQSFSFYENQFNLLGKTYINPIAFGGTRRYLFILEDTTIVNQDTTFTIFYRPRKGKNFEGMTGRLYINTNGYALEKVTASPYEDTVGLGIQIIQQYQFVDGKRWFPSKLSTEINFKNLNLSSKIDNFYIQGKGNTYIKNVQINPEKLPKLKFDNVAVVTKENAGEVDSTQWEQWREYKMTRKEERTYQVIDSISEENHLERRLELLSALLDGKLPMGYVNLDLLRILDYNLYEGFRLGAGIETSKKLMRNIFLGGYFAYGIKDQAWKYGGHAKFHLYRKRELTLQLKYQQDLLERGSVMFEPDHFSVNNVAYLTKLYRLNFEQQRLAEITLGYNIKSNIRLVGSANYQRLWYTQDYRYTPSGVDTNFIASTDNDFFETSLELKWNIREKVMLLGDKRISKGTKFPRITLKATQGIKGVFESDYTYLRLNAQIAQTFQIRGAGKLDLLLSGGKTIGAIPLVMQQLTVGTGRDWTLDCINTFQTALPSEFYHQEQASFFIRMHFNAFKTKAKWNEPQIALQHGIGYGSMSSRTAHNVAFKSMDKGLFEGGVVVNNLLTSGFVGVGVGVFYRYGYYASVNEVNNFVPKVSMTIQIN